MGKILYGWLLVDLVRIQRVCISPSIVELIPRLEYELLPSMNARDVFSPVAKPECPTAEQATFLRKSLTKSNVP